MAKNFLRDWIREEVSEVSKGKESYSKKMEEEEKEGDEMDLWQFQPLQMDEHFKERMF